MAFPNNNAEKPVEEGAEDRMEEEDEEEDEEDEEDEKDEEEEEDDEAEDEDDDEDEDDEDEDPPPISEHEVLDGADGRYKFRFELHSMLEQTSVGAVPMYTP
jgi:hypothetical protein